MTVILAGWGVVLGEGRKSGTMVRREQIQPLPKGAGECPVGGCLPGMHKDLGMGPAS